ncbi:MAG: NfeD family protein [Labilibaculum sp.]|nr:NfeD family protein [Labilibaculum sp.]
MELELWHIWLLLAVGLFVIEAFISTFVSACFGIASLATGIVSYFDFSIPVQLLVFIGCSALSFLIIKPYIKKHSISNKYQPDNDYKNLIGKETIVMEEINERKNMGKIVLSGSIWKAKSQFGEIISKDSFVKVLDIDYSVIIVKTI